MSSSDQPAPVGKQADLQQKDPPRKVRKKLFFLAVILLILEVCAWCADYVFEFQESVVLTLDQLVIRNTPIGDSIEYEDSKLRVRGEDEYSFTTVQPATLPADQRRVFVTGGSAAYGFGCTYAESFVGHLNEKFVDSDVHVYNAAHVGATSGELMPIVRRIVNYFEPKVLVIYCGNNEWSHWQPPQQIRDSQIPAAQPLQLDQASVKWLRRLCQSRLIAAMAYWPLRIAVSTHSRPVKRADPNAFERHHEMVGVEYCLAHPATGELPPQDWLIQKQQFLDQYESNLQGMIDHCAAADVRVVLMTVPFRYRLAPAWCHPQPESFDNEHETTVREAVARAHQLHTAQEYQAAVEVLRAAIALDPYPPVLHYLHGMCLEGLKRPAAAEAAYALCRENMIGNLGARLSTNKIIERVARRNQIPLVDLKAAFDAAQHARGGFFNSDLIFDDCHPSPLGHRVISESLQGVLDNMLQKP